MVIPLGRAVWVVVGKDLATCSLINVTFHFLFCCNILNFMRECYLKKYCHQKKKKRNTVINQVSFMNFYSGLQHPYLLLAIKNPCILITIFRGSSCLVLPTLITVGLVWVHIDHDCGEMVCFSMCFLSTNNWVASFLRYILTWMLLFYSWELSTCTCKYCVPVMWFRVWGNPNLRTCLHEFS